MVRVHKIIFFSILISLFMLANTDLQAQKKSKKKKKKEVAAQTVRQPVSEDNRRKAEMYHAEGEKYYQIEDYAKAFVLFQKSIETDPSNATAYYRIGQIFLKSGEYDKALSNAKMAIQIDDNNKYMYILLADIYSKQSDFVEAAKVYEEMLRTCKNANEYLFELAAIYIYQENYEEALKVYDRVEQEYGINDQVTAQKQKLYIKLSNLDMAIKEGEKLIEAYPGDSRYVIKLAEILISNEQYDKAIPYLENLINEYEEEPKALLFLSDIYRKKGDVDKSNIYLNKAFEKPGLGIEPKIQVLIGFIQNFPNEDLENLTVSLAEKVILAHPDEPEAYAINGDIMMQLNNREKALEYYIKSSDLGTPNFDIWQNILQLEVQLEMYDEAIMHGDKALEMYPNQPTIYLFLGIANMSIKDNDTAIEVLEKGKKMSGSNEKLKSFFNAQLGDAYNSVEEYKKSDEAYEDALAFDPENDHVLNNYSYFLSLRKEKLDLALKMSTKLVSRNPDNPTFLDTHAWVLYMVGKYEEARTYIEKALLGEGVSGTIIEHYGDILFKLGEVDSAVKQWQKAKGMDETSELIDKKIADRKLYE